MRKTATNGQNTKENTMKNVGAKNGKPGNAAQSARIFGARKIIRAHEIRPRTANPIVGDDHPGGNPKSKIVMRIENRPRTANPASADRGS